MTRDDTRATALQCPLSLLLVSFSPYVQYKTRVSARVIPSGPVVFDSIRQGPQEFTNSVKAPIGRCLRGWHPRQNLNGPERFRVFPTR
jgi:hypothetical protein